MRIQQYSPPDFTLRQPWWPICLITKVSTEQRSRSSPISHHAAQMKALEMFHSSISPVTNVTALHLSFIHFYPSNCITNQSWKGRNSPLLKCENTFWTASCSQQPANSTTERHASLDKQACTAHQGSGAQSKTWPQVHGSWAHLAVLM